MPQGVRRRPKDRKAQIARASAEAFSALGYYGVSMETIAKRVGISAAALYRHYSSKYELFRDAVLNLGQQLVDCTAFADEAAGDPQLALRRLVSALIDTAMANRESGGLYRWEGRYLRGDDQATLIAQMRMVHRRIQRPLMAIRPELTSRQRWMLSTSVLSRDRQHRRSPREAARHPGSGGTCRPRRRGAGRRSARCHGRCRRAPFARSPAASETPKYEALLNESMRLFNLKGYRDTSMEDIATAVGMPASGIYRYFSGKSDILAATFRRAADRLSAELSAIVGTVPDREEALTAVIDAYVKRSFDQPELDYVYYTERLNMTPGDQKILRNLQRANVESWVDLVVSVRPDWTPGQARFAVHAAMSLVIDLGRLMRYENSAPTRAVVERLLDLTLLGRYRLRAALPAR